METGGGESNKPVITGRTIAVVAICFVAVSLLAYGLGRDSAVSSDQLFRQAAPSTAAAPVARCTPADFYISGLSVERHYEFARLSGWILSRCSTAARCST